MYSLYVCYMVGETSIESLHISICVSLIMDVTDL